MHEGKVLPRVVFYLCPVTTATVSIARIIAVMRDTKNKFTFYRDDSTKNIL